MKKTIKKLKGSPHWKLTVEGVDRKMLFSSKEKAQKFFEAKFKK